VVDAIAPPRAARATVRCGTCDRADRGPLTDPTPPPGGGAAPDPPPVPRSVPATRPADRPELLRCERPFCPQCLREASVGYQCVECIGAAPWTGPGPLPGAAPPVRAAPVRVRAVRVRARRRCAARGRPDRRRRLAGFSDADGAAAHLAEHGGVPVDVVQSGSVASNASATPVPGVDAAPQYVASGQWWRLFTAGFLHFGPIHLVFNMVALWVIGKELEPVLGRIRFLASTWSVCSAGRPRRSCSARRTPRSPVRPARCSG